MKKRLIISGFATVLAAVLLLAGCKKDDPEPVIKKTTITVKINYVVNGSPLGFDTVAYENASGNRYSVSRLQYYLSDFSLGGGLYTNEHVQYVDAREASTAEFTLTEVPAGTYSGLSFLIGLDEEHNISGGLPNTLDNNNMYWPEQMGGGYHFMKFEGKFIKGSGIDGYAFHIGRNPYTVKISFDEKIMVPEAGLDLNLEMNLNEWFTGPHTYNLETEDGYTMGVEEAMKKVSENGSSVFTMK